jgi:predicted homoserine dehydrogenase-like protein
VCDMVARAAANLAPGTTLALAARHEIAGLAPMLAPAAPAVGAQAVPYYMAAGRTLKRRVAAGALLTVDDLHGPADSTLWRLRAEQDRVFFGKGAETG